MRIYGPNGTTLGTPSANVRKTSSTGFSLPDDAAATQESRATVAPKAAANIDALLALQRIEDAPDERRKRSVAHFWGLCPKVPAGKLSQCTVSRLQAILSVTTHRYIRRARADAFRTALH